SPRLHFSLPGSRSTRGLRWEQRIRPKNLTARSLRGKNRDDVHWFRSGVHECMGHVGWHFRDVGSLDGEGSISDDVAHRSFKKHMGLLDVVHMKGRPPIWMSFGNVKG